MPSHPRGLCGRLRLENLIALGQCDPGLFTSGPEMRCRAQPGCIVQRASPHAAQAIIQTAEKYNLGKRFLSLFIGHGVGIGANEPPYIGETLPGAPVYEFQPGMVFAVEPLIWVEGVRGGGGVRLEEMVLITDGDAHIMSRAPFEEKLLLS